MKKKYRKYVKQVSNKLSTLKEQLKSNAHYLPVVTGLVKSGLIAFGFAFSVLVLGFSSGEVHEMVLEKTVGDNVVFIKSSEDAEIQASGTGFQIKAKSGKIYTITNSHICELKNKDNIVMVEDKMNSGRFLPKRVIEQFEDNDLCIVEGLDGYSGLSMGSETTIGQSVWTIGYPLGQAMNVAKGRVKEFRPISMIAEGILPSRCIGGRLRMEQIPSWFGMMEVCVRTYDAVHTSMVIYGGNSGSPMVDYMGRVVGVVFAGNQRSNWGLSVPLKDLKNLVEAY